MPKTQNGIEAWVSRRALMSTGTVAWAGGLVLAVAAGGYALHHANPAAQAPEVVTTPSATESMATPSDTVESVETPAPIVLPADQVVAPRPVSGVTNLQKP